MSDFNIAIDYVLKNEGGFVNNSNDPGGATDYGVSLRWLKSIGQVGDINNDLHVDINDIKDLTKDKAAELYKSFWWDKYKYGLINSQIISNKVFDFSVNAGSTQSHICLQRAVRASNGVILAEDGIFGNETLSAVNSCNPLVLIAAFRSEIAGFYRLLNKPVFIKGWLKRAYQ